MKSDQLGETELQVVSRMAPERLVKNRRKLRIHWVRDCVKVVTGGNVVPMVKVERKP